MPAKALLRHVMALGSSGSGKTVLCKAVVEEAVRAGLPVICIDPQGDLCSLALSPTDTSRADPAAAKELAARADVVVFTPASRKGIALCADPLSGLANIFAMQGSSADAAVKASPGASQTASDDTMQALSRAANMIVALLGYDIEGDDGAGLRAVIDTVLADMHAAGRPALRLEDLTAQLTSLGERDLERYARYLDARKLRTACQRLARLDVGARRLLFHEGLPIDIDLLLGRGEHAAAIPGKTRVSVIYLNTLHSQEDKEFFIAALVERLYAWMLRNPSQAPQMLFYIDEVAPFVPPVRKPSCKPGLELLFKQARKYGVCCLMATQNPGDVDYKSMAQFGTWALGRLTTRQDLKKIEPIVKAMAPDQSDDVLAALPSRRPGEFALLSPDHFDEVCTLKSRWLLTSHETLDEERIEMLTNERWRTRFAQLEHGERRPTSSHSEPGEQAAVAAQTRIGTEADADVDDDDIDVPIYVEEPIEQPAAPLPRPAKRRLPPAMIVEDAEPREHIEEGQEPREHVEEEEHAYEDPADEAHDALALEPAKPSRPARPAVDPMARALGIKKSMTAREFAERVRMSESRARTTLKTLVENGLAREYKDGAAMRYYAVHIGARPDLGLGKRVAAVQPVFDEAQVRRRAGEMERSKLLGFIGTDESFETAELIYRPVYQVEFQETVESRKYLGLLGTQRDDMVGTVYHHATTLSVLAFEESKGIRFLDDPGQYASQVNDFDGFARFGDIPPAKLAIDETAWLLRRTPAEVKKHFRKKFSATPQRITVLFVPLWKIMLRQSGSGNYRVILLDALVGKEVDWPLEPLAKNPAP